MVIPKGLQLFQCPGRGCLDGVEAILYIIGHFITGFHMRRVESPTPWLVCRLAGAHPVFAIIEYDAHDMIITRGLWFGEADER